MRASRPGSASVRRTPTSCTRRACSVGPFSGPSLARRPVVVKLVADEAYERARRWGLFEGDLDAFQRFGGGLRVRSLRQARDRALRRVAHLVCPSAYLAARRVELGRSTRTGHGAAERRASAPVASRPRRGSRRARCRGPAARVRRADHEAEGARGRSRRPRSGRRRDPRDRRRRARICRLRRRRRRARSRRTRSLPRPARPRRRAHALPGCRRVAPHVVLGELPAHGRRGARRRDAGDRDGGRRRAGARARRRERPARPGGRHRGARGRDPPPDRRARACATGCGSGRVLGRAAPPGVALRAVGGDPARPPAER